MALEASPPASRVDLVGALRQAAITGLIAVGLLLPLIGFNTVQNIRNEIVLETRWPMLARWWQSSPAGAARDLTAPGARRAAGGARMPNGRSRTRGSPGLVPFAGFRHVIRHWCCRS
jgi:hypothetical protein